MSVLIGAPEAGTHLSGLLLSTHKDATKCCLLNGDGVDNLDLSFTIGTGTISTTNAEAWAQDPPGGGFYFPYWIRYAPGVNLASGPYTDASSDPSISVAADWLAGIYSSEPALLRRGTWRFKWDSNTASFWKYTHRVESGPTYYNQPDPAGYYYNTGPPLYLNIWVEPAAVTPPTEAMTKGCYPYSIAITAPADAGLSYRLRGYRRGTTPNWLDADSEFGIDSTITLDI